jgi:hypothetical protein
MNKLLYKPHSTLPKNARASPSFKGQASNAKHIHHKHILSLSFPSYRRVSEVSRKNKKGGVIIPDDNIT